MQFRTRKQRQRTWDFQQVQYGSGHPQWPVEEFWHQAVLRPSAKNMHNTTAPTKRWPCWKIQQKLGPAANRPYSWPSAGLAHSPSFHSHGLQIRTPLCAPLLCKCWDVGFMSGKPSWTRVCKAVAEETEITPYRGNLTISFQKRKSNPLASQSNIEWVES